METVFSQLLTKYIHSKDINVYSMAQFCGADRANMYKYISGDRNLRHSNLFGKCLLSCNLPLMNVIPCSKPIILLP